VMSGAKAFGFWFMPSPTMASVREGQFMIPRVVVEADWRTRVPRKPFGRQAYSKIPGQWRLVVLGRLVGT
jgi:hypothetical protein